MNGVVKGKELVFGEDTQSWETRNADIKPSPCQKTAHPMDPDLATKENEMSKASPVAMKISQEEKERGQQKEDEHNNKDKRGIMSGKSQKLGTFKRHERSKEKHQEDQYCETVLKKC